MKHNHILRHINLNCLLSQTLCSIKEKKPIIKFYAPFIFLHQPCIYQWLLANLSNNIFAASNSSFFMKKLKLIINKTQEGESSNVYVAESCSKKRNLQGINFFNVTWSSLKQPSNHTTLEQQTLAPENQSLVHYSSDWIDVDALPPQNQRSQRKCLACYLSHYYLIELIASQNEFARFKSFVKRNFHSLVAISKLKQYDKPFTCFFEGSNNKRFNLKFTITLINRYDSKIMPFISTSEKKSSLNILNTDDKMDVESKIDALPEKYAAQVKESSEDLKKQKMVIQCLKDFEEEGRKTCLKKIEPKESKVASKPPKKEIEVIQIFSDVEYEAERKTIKKASLTGKLKQLDELEMGDAKLIGQRQSPQKDSIQEGKHISEESDKTYPSLKKIDFFSVNVKKLIKACQAKPKPLFIEDHIYSHENQMIYRIRKAGKIFCLSEAELINEGYREDVEKYKRLIQKLDQIKIGE